MGFGFSGAGTGPTLKATTGPSGFALVNGTPFILTWTAPNDGRIHRFTVYMRLIVSANLTGGQIYIGNSGATLPNAQNGTGNAPWLNSKGQGDYLLNRDGGSDYKGIIGPGETIFVQQIVAVTAGAGVLYAELWAS
jgi:hypothetical protein